MAQLAFKLGIDADDIDEATLKRLQEEDQNANVEDDADLDIWQEMISNKRDLIVKREAQSDE